MSEGTVTTGAVVSTSVTVTLKDLEPVLPCASVALQVTVVVPSVKFVPEAGEQGGVMAPSMLSVAVAAGEGTVFPEAVVVVVVMSEGTVTTGAVVSTSVTVTLKDLEPVLPCASVALQVTVVVPSVKFVPEAGEQGGVMAPSMLSVAVAAGEGTVFPEAVVVVVVMSEGTVTTGAVVSTSVTVTLKDLEPVLPCASVALQVTVVVPSVKLAPEAGVQLGGMGPSMLSLADAVKVTVFPEATVVVVVMSAGTVTTGAVVSTSVTVTLKDLEPVLPCASVALQVTVVVPSVKFVPEAGEQVGVMAPSMLSVAVAAG